MSQIIPETSADYDETRIIERPDGFYWQDKRTDEEFGPFPTLIEAVEDMDHNLNFSIEQELEQDENLKEAEEELGIADWIDPETGEPAEGQTPHIEDH